MLILPHCLAIFIRKDIDRFLAFFHKHAPHASEMRIKQAKDLELMMSQLTVDDAWSRFDMRSQAKFSYLKPDECVMLFKKDVCNVLLSQYNNLSAKYKNDPSATGSATRSKGFYEESLQLQVPESMPDGTCSSRRAVSHPMTGGTEFLALKMFFSCRCRRHARPGEWVPAVERLHLDSPAIRDKLKAGPGASTPFGCTGTSAKVNDTRSFVLLASIYSDKTVWGKLSAYPVHVVCANGSLDETDALLREGDGLVALLPPLRRKPGATDEEMTQLNCEFLACCLDIILR